MGGLTNGETTPRLLGRCPGCAAAIPSDAVLIEYESGGGWPQVYAECPSCRDVVHPR